MYKHLMFAEIGPDEILFNYGDRGEKFYVILAGEIDISTPSPTELTEENAKPTGILSFFVHFYE